MNALPVSVVIPARNRAAVIARAVISAQRQSCPPSEIVVVDDGSTDDTADVAEAAGATVIRLPESGGSGAARNAGVAAASTEWIAFLDSDDQWLPHHLETVWKHRGDHVMVSAAADEVFEDLSIHRYRGHPGRRAKVLASPAGAFVPENPISTSGALVKRSVVLEAGGFKPLKRAQDLDLWIRVLERGTVELVPQATHLYYRHDDQVSADPRPSREHHLAIVRSYRDRAWWRRRHGSAATMAMAWDEARGAEGSKLRLLLRLVPHGPRLVHLIPLLSWRMRIRRRTRWEQQRGVRVGA